MSPRTPRLRALTVALVLATTLSGCGLFADEEPAVPEPTLSASPMEPDESGPPGGTDEGDLSAFYDQELDWKDCDGNDCATLEVPLDYADPHGETIELSVLRVPATGKQDRRVGSLVVNPGGPGGSGVDYASNAATYFGRELLQAFDIVGFDPRGVGRSHAAGLRQRLPSSTRSSPPTPTRTPPPSGARSDRLLRELRGGLPRRRQRRAGRAHVDGGGGARHRHPPGRARGHAG